MTSIDDQIRAATATVDVGAMPPAAELIRRAKRRRLSRRIAAGTSAVVAVVVGTVAAVQLNDRQPGVVATDGGLQRPGAEGTTPGGSGTECDRPDDQSLHPPPLTTTFRVELPNGRVIDTAAAEYDNEWEVGAADGIIEVQISATIDPDVTLQTLRYLVTDETTGAVVRTFDVGTDLTGQVRFTVEWDLRDDQGDAVPPGRYHLSGAMRVGSDARDPCYDGSDASEQSGLGYLIVE